MKQRKFVMNPLNLPEEFWVMEGDEEEVAEMLGADLEKKSRATLRPPSPPSTDSNWILRFSKFGPQTLVTPSGPIKVYRMILDGINPYQVGPE